VKRRRRYNTKKRLACVPGSGRPKRLYYTMMMLVQEEEEEGEGVGWDHVASTTDTTIHLTE